MGKRKKYVENLNLLVRKRKKEWLHWHRSGGGTDEVLGE